MTRSRKIITASLAALTLGATIASTATPAAAWGWRHHHGGFGGGALAAGLIGGLAVGAIAAEASGYGYDTCVARQPVYDDYGNFIGYRRARVAC